MPNLGSFLYISCAFLSEPLEVYDFFDFLFTLNDLGKNPDSILDFSTDMSVFYSIDSDILCSRSTCQHVSVQAE